MNIINDEYAIVLPPRCGTRWIGGKLAEFDMCDEVPPQHWWEESKRGNRKVLSMCRNPYTRLPSLFRWVYLVMTPESKDFTEWILSNEYKKYPPQAETYGDNQKNIYRYIKLENYREEFKKILGIDMGLYQGEYKDDKFDHLIDPDWMKNPEIISNYNEFEKVSFDLFGYKMIEL
tara:strand:+ start:2712 stop:3236 length:525 start_codon:yes stop_codon:yes gene_type:complete